MKLISQLAVTVFGLLTGGMLLIAAGLVPYWRSLEPTAAVEAFGTSLPTVGGTMGILSMVATVAMVVAAGLAFWKKQPGKLWIGAGAAATIIMLVTVPLYFGSANGLIAGGTLAPEAVTAEFATWQQMHWFRTVVGIVGLFLAVRAGYASQD